MPLVYQQNINPSTKLGVWYIEEEEAFFKEKVMLQREITHHHKRLQHLAGRYLLMELFSDFPLDLIKIADTNKPFLNDEGFHFSISHCGNYAAVIAGRVNRVGVDIEIISEKAEKVKEKFLSPEEIELITKVLKDNHSLSGAQLFTLSWSIKETMFKWYGAGKVDFRKNLKIDQIESSGDQFICYCTFSRVNTTNLIINGVVFKNNFLLTWTDT